MKNEFTLKEKDKIAKAVYKNFQRAQLDLLYMSQHYNYYPEIDLFKIKEPTSSKQSDAQLLNQLERKQKLEEYVHIMNQIHSHLSKESYFFIENEYLNFYDRDWWMHYYSRSTYYRVKHNVLNELIDTISRFWSDKDIIGLLR